ncbi:MAG TPA: transporter substrate-binding domain-containing protein [Roseateles sp.]|uniref:substrate-binding periplasmic protein n=1 Tax=Roseateles sp. TaxID=1971397 RepID=UPI002ED9D654
MGLRCFPARLLAVCIATAASGPAFAAEGRCGPYKVGLKEYPQVYAQRPKTADPAVDAVGLDSDFFALLAARSGCVFQYELESQPRVWARMHEGTLDITSWVIPTEERRQAAVLIPILTVRPLAYVWKSANASTREAFLAKSDLRAIAVKGTSYGQGYDSSLEALTAKRVSWVADVDTAVRVFLAHRVDLIVTYPWVMVRHLPTMRGRIEVADWYADGPTTSSGLALSKRNVSPQDQARLLEALKSMSADGTFKRLVDKYLPDGGIGFIEPIRLLGVSGAESAPLAADAPKR